MTITLATLPQATAQEVFDQVATHLLTQGKKSFLLRGVRKNCAFRGTYGLKCAAGCLMSDEEYSLDMEGLAWRTLVTEKKVPSEHCELIVRLQYLHDGVTPENWKRELEVLAREFKLRMPA